MLLKLYVVFNNEATIKYYIDNEYSCLFVRFSNNRVLSLLNKLDLTDRVLFDDRTFKQIEKGKIDYEKVNCKLDRFRNESVRFLMDSLITK